MADDPIIDPKAEPAKGDPPKKDPPADLGDAGKKALDEERKARRDAEKALKDAEAKIQQLEDTSKTELDKLREQVESLTKQSADNEAKALRAEVASAKGLTPAQAKRLAGASREELEADADEIIEAFPVNTDPPKGGPPSRQPKPDLKGGSDPTAEPTDVKSLVDSIPPTA